MSTYFLAVLEFEQLSREGHCLVVRPLIPQPDFTPLHEPLPTQNPWVGPVYPEVVGGELWFLRRTERGSFGDIGLTRRWPVPKKVLGAEIAKWTLVTMEEFVAGGRGIYRIAETGLNITGLIAGWEIEGYDVEGDDPQAFWDQAVEEWAEHWDSIHPDTPYASNPYIWTLTCEPSRDTAREAMWC